MYSVEHNHSVKRQRLHACRPMSTSPASGVFVTIVLVTWFAANLCDCVNSAGISSSSSSLPASSSSPTAAASSSLSLARQSVLRTSTPTDLSLSPSSTSCLDVVPIFESRGINSSEIPKERTSEVVLRYCELPATGTCCTYSMETRLAGSSRMQLDKSTKDAIGKLAAILSTRAQKFNEYFKELLIESKKEFHAMFKRTYGVIYEQNAYVFSDLFSELEGYYSRGKVDLAEAMDSFFNTLYQKMFTVLNAQYTFDDKYLGCVSEHMKDLKPFGDVPDKLSVQIKRSFVATRTYAQALNTAAEVAKNMMTLRPGADCTAAITKMQQCGQCRGHPQKPCANYCVNVMKACLKYYDDVDAEWDNFVGSMEKVSERLLGPFNIVMVVEPINIKISEAIMNFQETGQDISTQVFNGCGRPMLGRRRRSTADNDGGNVQPAPLPASLASASSSQRAQRSSDSTSQEIQYEPMQFPVRGDYDNGGGSNKGRRKNKKRPQNSKIDSLEEDTGKDPVMDKLIKDIRQKVKDSKKFWSNLPYQICNNEELAAQPNSDDHCWNGRSIDSYAQSIKEPMKLEFLSLTVRQTSLVDAQLYAMRTAISQLRNAYNGLDVEWSDQEESYYGSGSGSGSGIDDDDTGSGLGPFDFNPSIPDRTGVNGNGDGGATGDVNGNSVNYPNNPQTTNFSGGNNGGGSSGGGIVSSHPDSERGVNGGGGDAGTTSGSGGTATTKVQSQMSISRALITYMFPIVVAWFGGAFSDLL